MDEAVVDGVVHEGDEPVEVAFDVEQTAGLFVKTELPPGDDFEELFERSEPAGQRNERVGERSHQRLALVHRTDHVQLAHAAVCDLAGRERLRDHADHPSAGGERGVGQRAHQSHAAAAVDDSQAALREQPADKLRRLSELGPVPFVRAAEDTDANVEIQHVALHSMFLIAALASGVAWLVLLTARGGFWREPIDAHADGECAGLASVRVEAIVPARDEAEVVGASLTSLAAQRFAGTLQTTLVDDHSSDGTAEAARAALARQPGSERCTVVAAGPLERGWTGKLGALESGVRCVLAKRGAPDYWLFTDADIEHDPDNVRELVAKARRDGLDLVSLMVRLRCRSGWEQLLVPAFIFFFQMLYPFAWSNDSRRRTAAGGCVLLSNAALERIGGLRPIRGRLIDDCALAGKVKKSCGRIWLGLTRRTRSIRRYETLDTLWKMVKRTAYSQLGFSRAVLAATVAGMMLLYLVPVAAAADGAVSGNLALAAAGVAAWALMALAYLPTISTYELPPLAAFGLPLAALLYTAMTVDSALAHARKRGGSWKGRTHVMSSER